MTEPMTDRPTDTIRDAFEAMLIFLEALLTGILRGSADPTHTLATNAADAIEAVRRTDPHLLAFRDLVTRAAEEHNRRAPLSPAEEAEIIASAPGQIGPGLTPIGRADWTPERIREARERCAEIERRYQAGLESASNREDLALTVLAIRAAREDLPAALAEIERLNRLVVATANADPSWVERCTTQAAEIERLATALQAERAAWQEASGADSPGHLTAALKARRARLTAELAARVPADRPEVDAEDLWTDYRTERGIVTNTDREYFLAGVEAGRRTADASRPGLTEEQIETLAKSFDAKAEAEMVLSRKNREEPAEWRHEAVSVAWDEAAALLRTSRGETGPAPTWGEQAIAEHRRAADLGPGIGGAPIRVRPTATEPCKGPLLSPAEQADPSFADALLVAQDRHREAAAVHPTTETDRQRATLHAGDPASLAEVVAASAREPHADVVLHDLVDRAAEEHARTPDRTPPLSQAIAAEHARQEAEQGSPVSRADVVLGLIWSGLLREAERRAAEKEEQIAALRPAELAARAPADASLEAAERTWRGEWQRIAADIRSMSEAGKTPADILAILLTHLDMMKPLAVVRAVDASRPPPADEDTRPRLTERDADDIELARAVRDTLREVTHAGAIERLEELLDVEKEAAARPGLTEEQARLDFETACREARARGGAYCITKLGEALSTLDAALRASRGETGPAPTGLTSAMHAAQQRRSVPPASAFGEWPDEPRGGLTCPGCYDATGIAQPHDPRATLHAGDPASPFAPGSLAAGSATEDRILDRKRGGK